MRYKITYPSGREEYKSTNSIKEYDALTNKLRALYPEGNFTIERANGR